MVHVIVTAATLMYVSSLDLEEYSLNFFETLSADTGPAHHRQQN